MLLYVFHARCESLNALRPPVTDEPRHAYRVYRSLLLFSMLLSFLPSISRAWALDSVLILRTSSSSPCFLPVFPHHAKAFLCRLVPCHLTTAVSSRSGVKTVVSSPLSIASEGTAVLTPIFCGFLHTGICGHIGNYHTSSHRPTSATYNVFGSDVFGLLCWASGFFF